MSFAGATGSAVLAESIGRGMRKRGPLYEWVSLVVAPRVLLGLALLTAVITVYLAHQAQVELREDHTADAVVTGFTKHVWTHRNAQFTGWLRNLTFRDEQGVSHTVVAAETGEQKLGQHETVLYQPGAEDFAQPRADVWASTHLAGAWVVFFLGFAGVAWVWDRTVKRQLVAARKRLADDPEARSYWDFGGKG